MILRSPTISTGDFERETGWQLKAEGACKGDVCIPLPDFPQSEKAEENVDAVAIARAMGLPVVEDTEHGLISIGPESIGARALSTVEVPEVILPDLTGNNFALSSLRGQKVLVYAWAPY